MFAWGPATRIYLAAGATDMRKGFEGLYGLVRDRLLCEPLSGHLFLFANAQRNRLKLLFWRERAVGLREPTIFTLHLFQFQPCVLKAYLQTGRSITNRSHRLQCFAGVFGPGGS